MTHQDPAGGAQPTAAPGAPGASGAPDPGAPPRGAHALDPAWTWLRRLGVTRSSERWIGGVSGGLAQRWGVDPLVVRGAFVAAMFLGGIGAVLYALAWAFLPEPDGRIHAQELLAGRFDQAQLGIALLLLVGLGPSDLGAPWGDGWVWGVAKAVGWLTVAGLVIWWVAERRQRGGAACRTSDPTAPSAAGAPGGPGTAPRPAGPEPVSPTAYAAGSASSPVWGSPETRNEVRPGSPWDATTDAPVAASLAPAPFAASTQPGSTPTRGPRPPQRRTGPGRPLVATVVALGILAVAALLLAERAGLVAGSWGLTLGALLGIVGLGVVAAGLAGRRGGLLTTLAVVGLVLTPSALARDAGWHWQWNDATAVGDQTWSPTSRDDAADGMRIGAGTATIDLTGVPITGAELVVPVQVGAGTVVVTVPQDVVVRADVSLLAGRITWDVGGETTTSDGRFGSTDQTFTTDVAGTEGEAQLVLDIQVGAGEITIEGAGS